MEKNKNFFNTFFMKRAIFIPVLFLASCNIFDKDSILTIQNNNKFIAKNVKLKYTSSQKVVDIGNIAPSAEYKYLIESPLQEDSIRLIYSDSRGVAHEYTVVAYLIKGTGEDYTFEIK
jgi:hypothetical protein